MQLATALSATRMTGTAVTFVAADKRLLQAAQASGLSILKPEESTAVTRSHNRETVSAIRKDGIGKFYGASSAERKSS